MIKSGFNPKWYAVIHLNDGSNSKKQQRRRLDIDEVTKDISVVKNQIYTATYGKKWIKKKNRAKVYGVLNMVILV